MDSTRSQPLRDLRDVQLMLRYHDKTFWRQNTVVGVHREKARRWIVQEVQPLSGFEGCAANAALSRQNYFA